MWVGTLTAVVAVGVFALPAGIVGNGLTDVIEARKQANAKLGPIQEVGALTPNFRALEVTSRGRMYNFLHAENSALAKAFDRFINILIVMTAFSFMFDTLVHESLPIHIVLDTFEFITVCIFTGEYLARVYAVAEDPLYSTPGGRWRYTQTFLAVVDLLNIVPYWIAVCWTGQVITPFSSDSSLTVFNVVKAMRLVRILRFERYTHGMRRGSHTHERAVFWIGNGRFWFSHV